MAWPDIYLKPTIIKDSLRGSSVKIGTIQRILALPLRKDDTHKSRSENQQASRVVFVPGRVRDGGELRGRSGSYYIYAYIYIHIYVYVLYIL